VSFSALARFALIHPSALLADSVERVGNDEGDGTVISASISAQAELTS